MAPEKLFEEDVTIYDKCPMADRTSCWTATSPTFDLQLELGQIFLGVSCWGGAR